MNYYIRERLGPKQSLTKEGWLLCEEVPIARTGQMVYGPGEVPLSPGPDGVIIIDRFPEDVFRPETLASFNGKDVVDEHPEEDVKPDNWQWLTAGVVLNPRRGIGAQDDVLLADLMIKSPRVIDAVRSGKREVSCGYDADYIQAVDAQGNAIPGRGKQTNILGNHVALVEAGRCGPRCAIGDSKSKELNNMSWIDKVKAAFGAKDEAALNAALAEAPKGETVSLTTEQLKAVAKMTRDAMKEDEDEEEEEKKEKKTGDKTMDALAADVRTIKDSVADLGERVKKMEDAEKEREKEEEEEEKKTEDNEKILGELEMEAPPGTSDSIAAKAHDSALIADSWQEAVSLAEIIAPGIQVPTFDAKAAPRKTLDALCQFRRGVLDAAALQPELYTFMANTTGGKDYKKATCDGVRTLFRAVGNYKKQLNNAASRDYGHAPSRSGAGDGPVSAIRTPADLNRKLAEYYKN